jgi:amidase
MVAAAHGNDGGGSIRIPASMCGLVGLKATRGRVSVAPIPQVPGSIAVEGMLCRSVRDAAALLDVLAGPMPGDPHPLPPPLRPFAHEVGADPGSLRICVMSQSLEGLTTDPECVAVVDAVARVLADLGHVVTDDVPRFPSSERMLVDLSLQWSLGTALLVLQLGEVLGRPINPAELEPMNEALVERAVTLSAIERASSDGWRASIGRSLGRWWAAGHDVLMTPTLRVPPPRLGEVVRHTGDPITDWAEQFTLFPLTAWWNMTGQPAISLPLGTSADELPIGVQLIAAHGREDVLLRLSAQLEQAMPWHDRHPIAASLRTADAQGKPTTRRSDTDAPPETSDSATTITPTCDQHTGG